MAATALAPERVQQPQAASSRPKLDYKRGMCPRCQKPMLVLVSQPKAVCVECYAPTFAVGSQPIPVVK